RGLLSLWRVHRNLDFDAAFGAAQMHALIGTTLGGNGEIKVAAAAEIQQCAGQPVGAKRRIAVEQRDSPQRIRFEEETSRSDRIASDVVERAAADVRLVTDVRRVGIGV